MTAVTDAGADISILIFAIKPSFSTETTLPFKRFLALIFNRITSRKAGVQARDVPF
jgi:hypothetical protein